MSDVYSLEAKKAKKEAERIKEFLFELDSVCDTLYNRLEYDGIWDVLMQLENVRINYYIQFYEYDNISKDRKKT